MPQSLDDKSSALSRRGFLGAAGAAGATLPLVAEAATKSRTGRSVAVADPRAPAQVTLRVNGTDHPLSLDVRTTLLDALREKIGLTGTKKGCDHGQCGACTVHVEGKRVLSCLTLAAMVAEKPVTTIEGLARPDGRLHAMQQAFVDRDAFQCGYCTPGQIMSAIACVNEGHARSDADIREYMSGNLCRCAAYPNIVAAVKQARDLMEG
jgi:xanthine dehydrogenase YagT iron-sulfur-binding subunit